LNTIIFADWKLDLSIASKRLLALITQDGEDAAYYGTAFERSTTVVGPTNNLFIKLLLNLKKGFGIKIPINYASVSENLLSFILGGRKEKYNIKMGIVEDTHGI
jgi:hypothetical protein